MHAVDIMAFNDIVGFIGNKMWMSHIHQVSLINILVEKNGFATFRRLPDAVSGSIKTSGHSKTRLFKKYRLTSWNRFVLLKSMAICPQPDRFRMNQENTEICDDIIDAVPGCPFCYENIQSRIIERYHSVVAINDEFPVSHGHVLIIPKRHCTDFFHMTQAEQMDMNALLQILRKQILQTDTSVTGFNVGMNTGESAGQTIFHCHIHLIPRRDGDTPHPRGGVRGVIPHKMNY